MTSSERRSRCVARPDERGFTLAALLVILTVMMVFLAFTVPRMWSDVMKRERDYQTIWVMKQYARAIKGYADARKVYPTKLADLKEQNRPRILRQLYANPLSGKMDWVLVPFGTPTGDALPGTTTSGGTSTSTTGTTGTPGAPPPPGAEGGPFIGVRPPQTAKSFLIFRGKETYAEWTYTTNELEQDINASTGGGPGVGPAPGASTP